MLYKNIIANFISRFWSVLSNFLFVPLYIRFLGFESYSLISFTLVIAGVMAILDAGLTATLSREFAIKSTTNSDKARTLSTLEACYLILAVLIVVIIFLFAHNIADKWLKLDHIDAEQVLFYLKIIGVGVAFQLLANFYIGGLLGLEKQVEANLYQMVWGIVRNGLVIVPLIFYPSLSLFFLWQTISTILLVLVLRISLAKKLHENIRHIKLPKIEKDILVRVSKFAGGMLLISIVTGVNTQMDKIAISKLLSIDQLGYYTLAISLAQGMVILVNPVATAILPRFTALYSEQRIDEVEKLFHKTFLLTSILVFSVAANLSLNAKDILWIWTGNMKLAESAYIYTPLLTIGMTMLSIVVLPYNIAIANGYTKINNYLGVISLIITIPGYWFMISRYGALGAAITWGTVQTVVTLIFLHLINKRYFSTKTTFQIFLTEILKPVVIAAIIAFAFTQMTALKTSRIGQLMWIGLATLTTLGITYRLLLSKAELGDIFSFVNFKKNK